MDLLVLDIAITEKVVRSVGVYLFLLVAFRVAGKRRLGQNAGIGSDNSLGGARPPSASETRVSGPWPR